MKPVNQGTEYMRSCFLFVGFSLYSKVEGFGNFPKRKMSFWQTARSAIFLVFATPDVLANQQVTPVWQIPFSGNISTSKLTKGFSSLFGTSVHAYIIDQRLEKAASLLLESNLNVSQVAMLVGYSKASNFAAAFKRKYGVNPKNYKAEVSIG